MRARVDTTVMKNTETTEATIRAYAFTEDEAYATALKIADRKYEIFDSRRIRKVRGQMAWDVTFRVIVR